MIDREKLLMDAGKGYCPDCGKKRIVLSSSIRYSESTGEPSQLSFEVCCPKLVEEARHNYAISDIVYVPINK